MSLIVDYYDSYMESYYQNHVKFNWLEHYEAIANIIYDDLSKASNIDTNIHFIGATHKDLHDGCIPFERFAYLFDLSKSVHFYNISPKALLDIQKSHQTKNHFFYQTHDITDNRTNMVLQEFLSLQKNQKGIDEIFDKIEHRVDSFCREPYIHKPNTQYSIGYSLMVHSATLIPYQEEFYRYLDSLELSPKERSHYEKRHYAIVQKFNSWLLEFSIDHWFARYPNSKLTIFTDIDKIYYSNQESSNSNQTFDTMDLKVIDTLQSSYRITTLDQWRWYDEVDHFHTVTAIEFKTEG